MEQKDHKAIAEIFKKYDKLNQEGKLGVSPKYRNGFSSALNVISHDLSNYFEKEDRKYVSVTERFQKGGFDRKQFLKDCGV